MKRKSYIIQYFGYKPLLYNTFDEFNIQVANFLYEKHGLETIFVFESEVRVEKLVNACETNHIKIEFVNGGAFRRLMIFRSLCLQYRPSIVHVHFGSIDRLLISLYCFIKSIRLFNSYHSLFYKFSNVNEYRQQKGLLKYLILKVYLYILGCLSNCVLCVSEGVRNQVLSFAKIKRIKTCYLGVKTDLPNEENCRTKYRDILGMKDTDIAFCNVSAIDYIKGIDVILKAVKKIKDSNPQIFDKIHFFHIGGTRTLTPSSYEQGLYEFVKANDLENHVTFLGRRSDIKSLLFAFDFYVHPSIMEAISLAIMEAGLHKLPVIATNVGGIPEIVKNGDRGYLLSSVDNDEELADYILKLSSSSMLRKRMGDNICSHVSTNFDMDKNVETIARLYFQDITK